MFAYSPEIQQKLHDMIDALQEVNDFNRELHDRFDIPAAMQTDWRIGSYMNDILYSHAKIESMLQVLAHGKRYNVSNDFARDILDMVQQSVETCQLSMDVIYSLALTASEK